MCDAGVRERVVYGLYLAIIENMLFKGTSSVVIENGMFTGTTGNDNDSSSPYSELSHILRFHNCAQPSDVS